MDQSQRRRLTKQVVERQKFIEDVLDFVGKITREHGEVLDRQVHSSHIKTERELKDFEGFSFYTYGAYSMFGGQMARALYRLKDSEEPTCVLEVEWWRIEECEVKIFDSSSRWQQAIKRLIADEKRAVERFTRAKKQREERERRVDCESAARETTEEHHLQEEAKRLMLCT